MFKPFALFIGTRYTNLKRRDHFITFISIVSMLGIALGVMVLITVMSVMNGFTKEIRARILSVTPHVMFSEYGSPLKNYESIGEELLEYPGIEAVGPYVDGQGMLTRSRQVRGVLVKGILPEKVEAIFPLESTLIDGNIEDLQPGEFGVVLGKQLANLMNVWVGDHITLVIPEVNVTLAGVSPRLKRLKIVGVFEVGYIYDSGYAFMHMQDAAKIFKTDDGVSGLQLKLADPFAAPRIAKELNQTWGGKYVVMDWTTLNATYFSAVKMEKTMMFFTLILILAVAVFNLISTLVMVVTDKRADIAILRTLGASRRKIMSIFMYQGLIIGVVGTFLGILSGVALSLHVTDLVSAIERIFSVQLLSADVYFISFLPSDLKMQDVLFVGGSALVLSLLATLHPAWRAANVQPAEALRHEN